MELYFILSFCNILIIYISIIKIIYADVVTIDDDISQLKRLILIKKTIFISDGSCKTPVHTTPLSPTYTIHWKTYSNYGRYIPLY